jgi:hypothetical protein
MRIKMNNGEDEKRNEYQNQQGRISKREMSIKISNGEDIKEKQDKIRNGEEKQKNYGQNNKWKR